MLMTTDQADKLMATWKERARKFKPRHFDNLNQQGIENHLIQSLITGGEDGIGTYHRLMLNQGEWFFGRSLAKNYASCKSFKKDHRPRMKECIYNSQLFNALDYEPNAKYYEGFVCDGFIAVMHGWVVMPDKKVVDFTLEARDAYLKRTKSNREGISLENIAYLGVHVPNSFIRKKIAELETCVLIAHMYHLKNDAIIHL
jgi:hypothetical protein